MIGVYKIENKVNGKVYIGQSTDIDTRIKSHIKMLNKNEHTNYRLQNDWNVFGASAFNFEVVKKCRSYKLNEIEKTFIKDLQSDDEAHGYNLTHGNGKDFYNEVLATPNPVNEDAYFRDENGTITFNEACEKCEKPCKQSFRAQILICPAMS